MGPFKCYVTLFSWKLDPHPPPRNANNIEHYTFVTLFSRKSDTPHPHLRYVTLEWPLSRPLDRSKRFTLFALPGRPVHSDTNSASPGSILVMQQVRATTKSLTCPPLSIARYSFIQLSQLGRQWRERKCPIFEMVAKGDSNPGSLDCESGLLPRSTIRRCDVFLVTRHTLKQIELESCLPT